MAEDLFYPLLSDDMKTKQILLSLSLLPLLGGGLKASGQDFDKNTFIKAREFQRTISNSIARVMAVMDDVPDRVMVLFEGQRELSQSLTEIFSKISTKLEVSDESMPDTQVAKALNKVNRQYRDFAGKVKSGLSELDGAPTKKANEPEKVADKKPDAAEKKSKDKKPEPEKKKPEPAKAKRPDKPKPREKIRPAKMEVGSKKPEAKKSESTRPLAQKLADRRADKKPMAKNKPKPKDRPKPEKKEPKAKKPTPSKSAEKAPEPKEKDKPKLQNKKPAEKKPEPKKSDSENKKTEPDKKANKDRIKSMRDRLRKAIKDKVKTP